MFFALNSDGRRVYAEAVEKTDGQKYFCPICHGLVVLRKGTINAAHFAHKDSQCSDSWHYDMSVWHKEMQERFPENTREVVMRLDGETHRADVFKDGVVVEFQHSPISADEFYDRNEFYTKLGYKVVWVFDVSDQYEDGRFTHKRDNGDVLRWSNPLRVLKYGPIPQYKGNRVKICLFFGENYDSMDSDNIIPPEVHQINWCSLDYGGEPDYRWIATDWCNPIWLRPQMDMNSFFKSAKQNFYAIINGNKPYDVKYGGIKGYPRHMYMCNIEPDTFINSGICDTCKHCLATEKIYRFDDNTETRSYCAFPRIVNPKEELVSCFCWEED